MYKTTGVFPWVTACADVEGYFCEAPYLIALYGLPEEEAEQWRKQAAAMVGNAHDTFLEKRKSIMKVIWPNGGSPDAENLWAAKNHGKDDKLLDTFTIPAGFEKAPDLRDVVEVAISSQSH